MKLDRKKILLLWVLTPILIGLPGYSRAALNFENPLQEIYDSGKAKFSGFDLQKSKQPKNSPAPQIAVQRERINLLSAYADLVQKNVDAVVGGLYARISPSLTDREISNASSESTREFNIFSYLYEKNKNINDAYSESIHDLVASFDATANSLQSKIDFFVGSILTTPAPSRPVITLPPAPSNVSIPSRAIPRAITSRTPAPKIGLNLPSLPQSTPSLVPIPTSSPNQTPNPKPQTNSNTSLLALISDLANEVKNLRDRVNQIPPPLQFSQSSSSGGITTSTVSNPDSVITNSLTVNGSGTANGFTVNDSLTVGSNTIFLDGDNNKLGIGDSSP
ncbi:MAG TPA: hypothetical protein VJJ72_02725, partial [Candidatus Paceibacterota bacterium]